jgi:hypothetical protein
MEFKKPKDDDSQVLKICVSRDLAIPWDIPEILVSVWTPTVGIETRPAMHRESNCKVFSRTHARMHACLAVCV